MSRRRLNGETQKRRKKKTTQSLKRQRQVERVASTHVPAAFERSPEIATHDIAFLEAMRDMGVRQQPGRPISPQRQEAAEGIHIRLEQTDQDLFHARMAALDVQPVARGPQRGPSRPAQPGRPPADPDAPPDAAAAPSAASPLERRHMAHGGATAVTQGAAPRRAEPGLPGDPAPPRIGAQGHWRQVPAEPDQPAEPAGSAVAAVARGPAGTPTTRPPPEAAPDDVFTLFEEHAADADLMSAALMDSGSPLQRKYEGAPPPPAPRRAAPERMPEHPDAELDLHGKSLDQALHMVQNFLLTAFRQRLRHVLLVTGKGLNSGERGPVLRNAVMRWLEHDGGLYVESFTWAPPDQGGDGAVWVVLREWRPGQEPTPRPD